MRSVTTKTPPQLLTSFEYRLNSLDVYCDCVVPSKRFIADERRRAHPLGFSHVNPRTGRSAARGVCTTILENPRLPVGGRPGRRDLRENGGIHPEFIRNSSANQHHLFCSSEQPVAMTRRAPSARASRQATRGAAVHYGSGGGSDQGNTRCADADGSGRRKRQVGRLLHPPFRRSPRRTDAGLESRRHRSHE